MSISPNITMSLHKREISGSGYWGHPGIATVTFCNGNPQRCIDALRPKVRAVLDANPLIAGTFNSHKSLVHPTTGSDLLVDELLSVQRNVAVNRNSLYADLVKATGNNPLLTVQNGDKTLKAGTRVTKMVVVENESSPEFALIFSMSHVVADGHDYYKIFNMIAGSSPIEALDPIRVVEYETRESEWTGKSDFGWLTSLGLIKGMLGGLLFGPTAQW